MNGNGVHAFFRGGDVDLPGLARFLDELDGRARIREARSLDRREQARLFEAAEGFRPVVLEDFVPAALPPLQPVIHYGRNSLPVFRIFEKRFCRADTGRDELWGYNEQSFKALTGPGYFTAYAASESEVVIDYLREPPRKPPAWPPILPNSARLGRFVYFDTKDLMRGVSRHVTIGRATRGGSPMDNWFVLCRRS